MSVFFKDIIGQREVVAQLRRCVDENRLAHALLITGPRGNGKLAIAVALANYLLCGKDRTMLVASVRPALNWAR